MDELQKFMLQNAMSIFGGTITFAIIVLSALVYLFYTLRKKQVPDSYNESKAQCDKYTDNMNKRNIMFYQNLLITFHNGKAISINCPFWKPKNKCEIEKNQRCKFFN